MAHILIVDDDPSLREVLEIALDSHHHTTRSTMGIFSALQLLDRESFHLIIADLRLGTESGLDLLQEIRKLNLDIPVLMITAYADNRTAMEALQLGARDYISKPFDVEEFLLQVNNLLQGEEGKSQNLRLGEEAQETVGPLIGESQKMQEVFSLTSRIAPSGINVLISGESGTGKELIARAIHEHSDRKSRPFLAINCGGVPETLVESELFGYRKGAFTGAGQAKSGLLERAHQGTFMLDEITELSPQIQVKLLRCLQDGTFLPLGSTDTVQTDIRFIAATNKDPEEEVSKGRLREDLFYRLSGMILHLPPLRERGEDLFLIADHLLEKYCREQNKAIKGFSTGAKQKLRNYHFPGNIRELENIIERSVALESGPYITPPSLMIPEPKQEQEQEAPLQRQDRERVLQGELSLDQYMEELDKEILSTALERTRGNKKRAAEMLGLSFRQLRYRLSKHGMK